MRSRLRIKLPFGIINMLLLSACLWPTVSHAIKIDYTVSGDVELSDNSTKVPTAPLNESRYTTKLEARLAEAEGKLTYSTAASFRNIMYSKGTFRDQDYFRLSSSANWQLFGRRLNLQVLDYYDQRKIDSLGVDTPTNTQNTNVLRISPTLSFRPAPHHSLVLTPSYSDFYYQQTLNDNQHMGLGLRWIYKMYRSLDVSASYNENEIDYEISLIEDQKIRSFNIGFDITRKRSKIALRLGETIVERTGQADIDGSTFSLNWDYVLSSKSQFAFSHRVSISDTSTRLLDASSLGDDLTDDQLTADVIRDKSTRLRYTRKDSVNTYSLSVGISKQDYKILNDDRERRSLGVNWNHAFSALDTVGVNWVRTDIDVPTLSRFDERSGIDIFYSHRHTTRLTSRVGVKVSARDSNQSGSNFDESVIMFRLLYNSGR